MKLNNTAKTMLITVVFLIGMQHIACVNDGIAGGNSSETTNVAVITPDGKPASFAKIKVIDAENWSFSIASQKSPVLDSAEADECGVVSFKKYSGTPLNLQIDHQDGGALIRNFAPIDSCTSEKVTLQKYSAVSGNCIVDQGTAQSVTLEGTCYESVIKEDKSFLIPAVSPGAYPLLVKSSSGDITISNLLNLRSGQSSNLDTVPVNFSDLLIDDFKDGDYYSILGRITKGFWYGMVDTLDGGTSQMTMSIGPDTDGLNAIMATIVLNYRPQMAWAGFGVSIGKYGSEWDLSAISGISFEACGRGTVRVSLESGLIDTITPWPHFGYVVTLDSTWKSYDIPVDSLSFVINGINLGSGVTWEQAVKRSTRLEFEAESIYRNLPVENVTVKVRNVYLKGISASDLLLQTKSN